MNRTILIATLISASAALAACDRGGDDVSSTPGNPGESTLVVPADPNAPGSGPMGSDLGPDTTYPGTNSSGDSSGGAGSMPETGSSSSLGGVSSGAMGNDTNSSGPGSTTP